MKKILFAFFLSLTALPLAGAEFQLHGPTVELRLIQFCEECDKALVVTTIPAGGQIQCPHCETIQQRYDNKHLLTKIYQVCPRCSARLDVTRQEADCRIRCANCSKVQTVLKEAVVQEHKYSGTGRCPNPTRIEPTILPDPEHIPQETPKLESQPPHNAEPQSTRPGKPHTAIGHEDLGIATMAPGVFDDTRMERLHPTRPTRPALDSKEGDFEALPITPDAFGADEEDPRTEERRIIARINGHPLYRDAVEQGVQSTMEDVRLRLGRLASTEKGKGILARKKGEVQQQILHTLIDRMLILQAAEEEGFAPTQNAVLTRAEEMGKEKHQRAGKLVEEARMDLILKAALAQHARGAQEVAPVEIRTYYEKYKDRFMQPRRARLRALVVYRDRTGRDDTRPITQIAREIVNRLQKDTFPNLVAKYSEGPQAHNGGRMTLGGEELVPTALLAGAVQYDLKKALAGQVMGPVMLASAIAFFQVDEIREAKPRPLTAVSSQIEDLLQTLAARDAFDSWVQQLRKKAQIDMAGN